MRGINVELLLAASLAGGPAYAIDRSAGDSPESALVTLFTTCEGPTSEKAFKEMREEVEESLEPAGITLAWRQLDLSQAIDPVESLVVVRFRGICRAEFPDVRSGEQGPLGRTHVSEGEVLPFCEVNCDRVRDFIKCCGLQQDGATRERTFGRALGRVVAHELYHVLANTQGHAKRGLAKSLLEPVELVGENCDFEADSLRKIRRGPRTQPMSGDKSTAGESGK